MKFRKACVQSQIGPGAVVEGRPRTLLGGLLPWNLFKIFGIAAVVHLGFLGLSGYAAEGGIHHAESWDLERDGSRILNFLLVGGVVFYLLKKYAWKLVVARSEEIKNTIAEMERTRKDAQNQLAEFERKAVEMKKQAETIQSDAQKQAEFLKEEIVRMAQKEAEEILKRARDQIDLEANQKKWELQKYAAELAIQLAEEMLAKQVAPENHRKFVREYLEKMGSAK